MYPQITLSAGIAAESLTLRNLFDPAGLIWNVAAGLVQPVFDAGMRRAQRRSALALLQASAADYQQTVLQAFEQVADLLLALSHDSELAEARQRAVEAASRSVTLQRANYENGGGAGLLELLDAQRQYRQALLGYVQATEQHYQDTAALLVAMGWRRNADGLPAARPSLIQINRGRADAIRECSGAALACSFFPPSLGSTDPMAANRKDVVNTPAGGWGALNAVESHLARQETLIRGNRALLSMNKPGGFDCPSCAWPDPRRPHTFEYCENGAKAVAWEATRKRATPEFFAQHTLEELRSWTDHQLEDAGRLTHPLRYNADSDKYEAVPWETAFTEIAAELRGRDPRRIELYTSGRASNEAAFLWQLFGRLLGTNNFPDCSNMCHETTTVALPESIGVGKGTCDLEDLEECDAIFIFGQNPGTNSPRMMGYLHDMARRGVPIITFNPLRERALVVFADPQNAVEMLTRTGHKISSQYHQVRVGGDIAAIQGICKAVIAAHDADNKGGCTHILDVDFIGQHTHGFEAFATYVRSLPWEQIEHYSGLTRTDIEAAADVYMNAQRVVACWGMGITQHRRGGDAMQQIVNLLLLRGNIGRRGAGPCPIRGHSNVQGDRTVGIYQKPKEPFLRKLDEVFGFTAPRAPGHDVAECCEAILRDEVDAFLALGGNFFCAIPDTDRVSEKVSRLRLTVYVATKPNRSHLTHGQRSYVLPCQPGGFRLPNAARVRQWNTPSGRANLLFKEGLLDEDDDAPESEHLQLITLRSHDQFNTTVYSNNDRYRGVRNERMVVFMNQRDIQELGLHEGACIEFTAVTSDGIERRVSGFKVVSYDIPPGCCAAYYPETNALLALSHRDERSNTPAAKSVPVRVTAMRPGEPVSADPDVSEDGCHRSVDPQTVPLA